jgi:FkbM family methyltransferase
MSTTELLYDASERVGLAPYVSRLYWLMLLRAQDWRCRSRVGDVEVTFRTTGRMEFLRASTFLGERPVLERFLEELGPSEVVWDVGACVGTYACFAANVVTDGYVVAFEPETTNRSRLVTNLAANAPLDRWTTRPVALTDRDESVGFERGAVAPGNGHHHLSPDDHDTTVVGVRGDSLVGTGLPAPDVLKIDVQGAELATLRGMGSLLADVDRIYAELHVEKCKRYGTTADEVESYLVEHGFTITRLGPPRYDRDGVYHVVAYR